MSLFMLMSACVLRLWTEQRRAALKNREGTAYGA